MNALDHESLLGPLAVLAALLATLFVNRLADWLPGRAAPDLPAGLADDPGRALDLSHLPALARWRPVAVAIVLAIGFVAVARGFGWEWRLVPGLFYVTLFVLITVIDLEHRIVPNEVVLGGSAVALGFSFVPGHPVPAFFAIVGGAAGLLIFGAIYLVGLAVVRRGSGPVGLGDVKLAALIGLITGFPAVLGAIFVGAFVGGLVMGALLLTRRVDRQTYVPYAPFLLFGAAWTYFFSLKGYLS